MVTESVSKSNAPAEGDADGLALALLDGLSLADGLYDADGDTDTLGLLLGEDDGLRDGDADGLRDGE